MSLFVGLGNPGKKYQNTRHNIGFTVLDYLYNNWLKLEGFSTWQEKKKFQAHISEGMLNGQKTILAKPYTYMNDSGSAVQSLISFYKIMPYELFIIHDEIDLPFGDYKIQTDRSSAGHKGIQSIIDQIGTQNFTRIRIGIARTDKSKHGDTAVYVLKKFTLLERLRLKEIKEKILAEIKTRLKT